MLSYRLKVSSPYSPENVLIPTKSENLKEPPPLGFHHSLMVSCSPPARRC